MPLTPRFTWEQDAASVALQVTLPGAALKSVDIYISNVLVKINAAPYVLLLDLYDAVDDTSTVVKRNASTHVLHITLNKIDAKMWHQLELKASKAELKERRLASMERKRQKETSLAEKRKDRKYQEEKQTLRAQMAVDDTNRQILADLKAEEKAREEAAMYESFKEMKMKQLQREKDEQHKKETPNNQQEHRAEQKTKKRVSFAANVTSPTPSTKQPSADAEPEVLELDADGSFDVVHSAPPISGADDDTDEASLSGSEMNVEDIDDEEENQADCKSIPSLQPRAEDIGQSKSVQPAPVPPPRAPVQTEIQFTPRLFPTPSRESKAAEEEDWMLKNRKHLKKHQGLRGAAAGYDISETDPAWLKAKGDDFYRSRDYRSAVNAYSEALTVVEKDHTDLRTTCLSNRAACHLQLGEFEKCLDDCTQALACLPDTPAAAATTHASTADDHSRVVREFRLKLKLLVRRGTALCRLGKFTEAKADYGVALTMDKQNNALQHDFAQLLLLEKSHQAKERGDECFKQNQLDDAVALYNESLQLHPHSIACLSNRAACYLRRHEHEKCVEDCSSALQLLQQHPTEAIGGHNGGGEGTGLAFFAAGPAPGSIKRREWVVKTLIRRGTAFMAMHKTKPAEADYASAAELDPSNAAIQADLNKIRQQILDQNSSFAKERKTDSGSPEAVAP